MTQRIFDIENEKDYADLWDILPDNAEKIKKSTNNNYFDKLYKNNGDILTVCVLNINWHDKTEIIRPIQEATEADIGKLCYFWNSNTEDYSKQIGLLTEIKEKAVFKYILADSVWYTHCRRLTKQEIEKLY